MPNKQRCCVPLCYNKRSELRKDVTFHRFPTGKKLRTDWIVKIRRDVGKFFKISKSTKVCSEHFNPSELKRTLAGKRFLKKGAVPSIFKWTKQEKKRRIIERESTPLTSLNGAKADTATVAEIPADSSSTSTPVVNNHDYCIRDEEVDVQLTTEQMLVAAQERIQYLENKLDRLEMNSAPKTVQLHAKPDAITKFYTGFPSYQLLSATFYVIQPTAENMFSWSQVQRLRNKGIEEMDQLRDTIRSCKLNLFQQFYLFLHKLRLGSFNQELADKFSISVSTVSRVFLSWANFLYFVFGSMPIWPSRKKIQKHMPECFKQMYPRCRGIIDASEILTEAPSSLVLNSEFYSSYKSHTTFKGNIVISPSGEVIHVSSLFTGSISDKELVKQSGLLNLLEPGDQILADKGFTIQDLLTPLGCELAIPAFLSSKGQFTKQDLMKSKQIHNLRVHVERAIRRVKEFHFFDRIIPLSMTGSINQLWTISCLLVNFQGPLFYEKSLSGGEK